MTTPDRPTDERLLELLKDSLDADTSVDDDTIDMLMTGYDIVHADTLEAEMVFDSFADAAVRSSGTDIRHLRFELGDVVFSFEIDPVASTCAGRVEPAGGALSMERLSGSQDVETSDTGSFEIRVEDSGPLRLHYAVNESTVVTPWFRMSSPDLGS